jgi:hypothetical protein
MLLDGDITSLKILRNQFINSKPTEREYSGSGTFTTISVSNNSERIIKNKVTYGDVYFELKGIKHGGGAILFIENGYLTMLECYLNADEEWPEAIKPTKIFYDSNPRDLTYLKKLLDKNGLTSG